MPNDPSRTHSTSRRRFLQQSALALPAWTGLASQAVAGQTREPAPLNQATDDQVSDDVLLRLGLPAVVSTWNFGAQANSAAWDVLSRGGRALDGVETGARRIEDDASVQSVGYGGLPDRDGQVTLDASIMDEHGNAGSVAFLRSIRNPVSVARAVMEATPHVMLVGAGAQRFALQRGFAKQNLLTSEAKAAWQAWKANQPEQTPGGTEPHDTLGILAADSNRRLSGACTTSGMAFKMHGRVGDSPIIGAALYVDSAIGAACATGLGEEVMKTLGSFLIVELMRQGANPTQACIEAVQRLASRPRPVPDLQVGYVAMSAAGEVGAYALRPGFQIAARNAERSWLLDVQSRFS